MDGWPKDCHGPLPGLRGALGAGAQERADANWGAIALARHRGFDCIGMDKVKKMGQEWVVGFLRPILRSACDR